MKALIKKAVASVMGAATMCMSLAVPAMATDYDLADYPAPFVNGDTNFLIVVGEDAMAADIAGGIDVAVRLGAENGDEVACGSGSTSVSGGEDKELGLGISVADTFTTLKDNHLAGFQDTKIRWNSEDLDIEETLSIDGLELYTSDSDTDFGSDVYLGTTNSPENFVYKYVIDDSDFDYSLVADTGSKKLEIKFLGRSLEVTDVDNGTSDKITFTFGEDLVLGVGDSAEVDGTTIEVNSIGQGSVSITVGTETKIIADDEEYDFGDFTVKINDILYTDDAESRQADISVGSDIEKTVKTGDPMEIFGEPDDDSDAEWVWYIDASGASNQTLTIGAQFNQKYNDPKDDVKVQGEAYYLPEEYASVSIQTFSTEDYANYEGEFDSSIDVKVNEAGTSIDVDLDGISITSDVEDTGFTVNVDSDWVETDTVYILEDGTYIYGAFENSDNKVQLFYNESIDGTTVADQLRLYYQDSEINVTFAENITDLAFNITEGSETGGEGDIVYDIDLNRTRLGDSADQAEPEELTIGGTNIGTAEEDYRTHYGMILGDPDSNGDSDKFEFSLPSERVTVTILVEGPETTVTTTSGETVIEAVPITDDIARLDTEVTESMKQNKNLILIGGPAVNMLTAQALGLDYPSYGADSGIPEDAALLQMVNGAFNTGKAALIVAGWEAENTRAACSVLQQFSAYDDLTGTAVVVEGTDTPTLSALE